VIERANIYLSKSAESPCLPDRQAKRETLRGIMCGSIPSYCILFVHSCIRALYSRIRVLHSRILVLYSLVRALYSRTHALCSRIRVLCSRIRVLCSYTRVLYSRTHVLCPHIRALYSHTRVLNSRIPVLSSCVLALVGVLHQPTTAQDLTFSHGHLCREVAHRLCQSRLYPRALQHRFFPHQII
jgi:hypothetical protein